MKKLTLKKVLIILAVAPMTLAVLVIALITSNVVVQNLKQDTKEELILASKGLKEYYEYDIVNGYDLVDGFIRYDTSYIDRMKSAGVDLTLFKGNIRFMTTITDSNGQRIEGTPAFGEESFITLTYSDHEPLGNMRTTFLNDIFFRAVEEESKSRVKIIPHWNGEISVSYEALKTVKDGSKAQITVIVPEYCAKELPLHQLFKSFPTGPTGQRQVNFFRDVYGEIPELMNEIEAQGLHVIFVATGYPAAFFSSKPMTDLRALKGQKWRSASFWHKDFLTNAGAIPVTMAWGQEVFDALNDGTLDGLIVNIDSGYDINAHKAATNILTSQKLWLGHEYIIAMNKSAWEKLSDNDKKAIEKAAEFSYSKLGGIMDDSFSKQLEILRAEGVNVRILNDDEIKFWEQITDYESIQEKWVMERKADGLKSADIVLDEVRHLMKNFADGAE